MSNKPKCPVFGCTIPRGIPHEHPAGVSAVMRDPADQLNANERIELLYHRHLALVRNQMEFNKMANAVMAQSEVERQMRDTGVHVIRDAPMFPGRKLRDALLLAGHKPGDTLTLEEFKPAPRRKFRYLVPKAMVVCLLMLGMIIWALMRFAA